MVVALVELLLLVLVVGLLLYGLGIWSVRPTAPTGPGPGRSAARRRAKVTARVATARWAPAHDEVDGTTRVLLRRSHAGPDGLPIVLEDRVYTTFSAADPAWEARFTEAMSGARFRCSYLNAEESTG